MTANINLINRRQDVRGIARILLCPFRMEPDINQSYSRPGKMMRMKRYLNKVHPLIQLDSQDDSRPYFMLWVNKVKK